MNLKKFYELMDVISRKDLLQNISEWRCFLEFVDAYFKNRNVTNPIVVEIGTYNNKQKQFYQELLNAEYIGIDIIGTPDILGDSHNQSTVEKLKNMLNGRKIDLLFIDGDHSYEGVNKDYELYSPFAKYIIAFHDIYLKGNPDLRVYKFWDEMMEKDENIPLISFRNNNLLDWPWPLGIGVMLVGNI